MDTTEKRRRWIIHRRLEGWKVQDIADALRISEKTADRWCSVYRKHRLAGLQAKSHRPHTIHRTPQVTVDLILQLRSTRNWGPCRIEGYLRNYEAWIYATHQAFINYWNYERPHQGIGYLYPADVYFRDLRDTS